jgi:allophanate hydrolase
MPPAKASLTASSLRIASLAQLYRSGALSPAELISEVYARIAARGQDHVWIHLIPEHEAVERARALSDQHPLYGIPFAVKDNIDVAGLPTTAGCPAFRYVAEATAPVVERLITAGAILIGKTNLDQFATGLTGTRSPYGIPTNPFDRRYIPGGSSSGPAVAVSSGLVSFALGTDTAGSGRVPAAFNNIVGLKPTRGFFSTRGVVPACRTLDCVSIFALTCDDAAVIAQLLAGYDCRDPFSRRDASDAAFAAVSPDSFRFGAPNAAALEFFGDANTPRLFEQAIANLEQLGGTAVTIEFALMREASRLLYEGPWVAERMAALRSFFRDHAEDAHPVTRRIIEGAGQYSAVDAFQSIYRLAEIKRRAEAMWEAMDVLLLPTAGTCFTIDEVAADPIQRNTELGYYTNGVNLLDLCGVAVPAGASPNGIPFGVTLAAPAGRDGFALAVASRLHRVQAGGLGATGNPIPVESALEGRVVLAVVGAHMRGLPLHPQLQAHGARFVRACRTASSYRLYELPHAQPAKPGLLRVSQGGSAIEAELWDMAAEEFGKFVGALPSPLAIGTLILDTGEQVKGFLCEFAAVEGAVDISAYGGWRTYYARHCAEPKCDKT